MKKHLFLLFLSVCLFTYCSSQNMQGHPAAIQAGAAVGGVLGSIVGDHAGGYYGSQFGALIGTMAGVAVGNAVSTPRTHESASFPLEQLSNTSVSEEVYHQDGEYGMEAKEIRTTPIYTEVPLPADDLAPSGLSIQNLRFIDANHNHVIDAEEDCKLIFDLINESSVPIHQILPKVKEVSGIKHLFISPSVQISSMEVGSRIRYTATVRGGRKLKSGQAHFKVYVTEGTGTVSKVHTFTLPTHKRNTY